MSLDFKVVIPARYASTRLPGKPLLPIAGKAMIAHVCERALEAKAQEVVVATDDPRIADAVDALGIHVVMTNPNHQSGTERIAEVARHCQWQEDALIVNLQGDEPLIPPAMIHQLAHALAMQSKAQCATLATAIAKTEEILNPNAVKVVINQARHALYFSRAPIPWDRDHFPPCDTNFIAKIPYLRHIGMYAYTVGFLKRYCAWSPSPLESVESLEQLRILWHGETILVDLVEQSPPAGVDTAEDLARVERILRG